MAANFPGPYQLRIYYTVQPATLAEIEHVVQFNVQCDPLPSPGDLFNTIKIERRNGVTVDLDDVVDAFVGLAKAFYSSAEAEFTRAELWSVEEGTFNMAYVSTYDISVAGTNVGTSTSEHQITYTFRTLAGGVMKVVLLETVDVGKLPQTYTGLSGAEQNFVDWFTTDTSAYCVGRDDTYPFVFLRQNPGYNESLFRKRWRT